MLKPYKTSSDFVIVKNIQLSYIIHNLLPQFYFRYVFISSSGVPDIWPNTFLLQKNNLQIRKQKRRIYIEKYHRITKNSYQIFVKVQHFDLLL